MTASSPHSVFAYPGNKARFSKWVVEHLPPHRVYVELFGGAAGVLANKPPSFNEVYNDIDGDLVQFFDVLRERGDELTEWCQHLIYSREKYEEWASKWYDGWRPTDPVRQAGVFYFLRQVSFNGKYYTPGGFATSTIRNQARTFSNQVDRLEMFADRFSEVVVEHLNWKACLESWDGNEALFYADPPYPGREFRYREGPGFDHDAFLDTLADIEGDWIVSYPDTEDSQDHLAELLEIAETVSTRETKYRMASGYNGDSDESTEVLAMGYDPRKAGLFHGQHGLEAFTDGGSE